jgi:hypothetical protein
MQTFTTPPPDVRRLGILVRDLDREAKELRGFALAYPAEWLAYRRHQQQRREAVRT